MESGGPLKVDLYQLRPFFLLIEDKSEEVWG